LVVVKETEVLDTIRKKINPIISRLWEICQEREKIYCQINMGNCCICYDDDEEILYN